MYLEDWNNLKPAQQKRVICEIAKKHSREMRWYQGFEEYITTEDSFKFICAFIEATKTYYKTHVHYGGKAIVEHLRWNSSSRDCDGDFKINNNYTTDVTRLVKLIFPAQLNAFFRSRKGAGLWN